MSSQRIKTSPESKKSETEMTPQRDKKRVTDGTEISSLWNQTTAPKGPEKPPWDKTNLQKDRNKYPKEQQRIS